MSAEGRIYGFQGEYRWLSNFWPSPIVYQDKLYRTAEHLYQALKTLDPVEREKVRNAHSPGAAKRLGREITLRPDWERKKLGAMDMVIAYKFDQNEELRERLVNTLDAPLVEANTWHDMYWGVCTCPVHEGRGRNQLGLLLMDERELWIDG